MVTRSPSGLFSCWMKLIALDSGFLSIGFGTQGISLTCAVLRLLFSLIMVSASKTASCASIRSLSFDLDTLVSISSLRFNMYVFTAHFLSLLKLFFLWPHCIVERKSVH